MKVLHFEVRLWTIANYNLNYFHFLPSAQWSNEYYTRYIGHFLIIDLISCIASFSAFHPLLLTTKFHGNASYDACEMMKSHPKSFISITQYPIDYCCFEVWTQSTCSLFFIKAAVMWFFLSQFLFISTLCIIVHRMSNGHSYSVHIHIRRRGKRKNYINGTHSFIKDQWLCAF